MGRWLIAVLVAMTTAAYGQRQMSVPDLVTFIKSSVQLHNDDRAVADTVRRIKLTNRLDAGTVEDLQGLGAGPRTLAALRELISTSANLPVAAPAPPPPPQAVIPPPSPAELKKILAEITEKALDYTKSLPNFICAQVTTRSFDPSGTESWHQADKIQEQLSYVDGKEDYKVVLVNNLPVINKTHEQLGGITSSGEFGTMLYQIFAPPTQTHFDWERWATLRGKRMYVFSFRVLQPNSDYSIRHEPSGRTIIAGYHGLIYADAETRQIMRIKMDCDNLEDFPINQVSLTLDYAPTKISEQNFVLPMAAEVRSREGKVLGKNVMQFSLYRKFSSEATITFDAPDSIPEDQLKEQPATPAPGKKK
ncbi:MAG: hypothetical protein JWO19_4518 [Bryobacterales bacterium]|nr:hypothetical protein [Bryobacterales bacterium]